MCNMPRIRPIHTVEVKASLVDGKWLDGNHLGSVAFIGFGKTQVGTRFPIAEVGACHCRYGDAGCKVDQVTLKCRSMFGTFNLFRQDVQV